MKYYISENCEILLDSDGIYLITVDDVFCLEVFSTDVISCINLLKDGCHEHDLKKYLNKAEVKELLSGLDNIGILRKNCKNEFKNTIVEKQWYYWDSLSCEPNEIQKEISSKTVCILGIGGVGSVIFQHLIAAGVQSFILIDNDKVKKDNFNRQFIYTNQQLDQKKINCAREYAIDRDEKINIETYSKFICNRNELEFLEKHSIDIFICAADLPQKRIQKITSQYCYQKSIPFICAEVGIKSGCWGPLIIPQKTECYVCFTLNEEKELSEIEKKIIQRANLITPASFAPTNTIISAFLAKDVILFLGKQHVKNSKKYLNFETLNFEFREMENKVCNC